MRTSGHAIVRGLWRRAPRIDIVRVQDIEDIAGQSDIAVLTWAGKESRVVLSHDLATMIPAIREQGSRSNVCAPVVLVPDSLPVGQAIEEILLTGRKFM